jgi:hypothetical protein
MRFRRLIALVPIFNPKSMDDCIGTHFLILMCLLIASIVTWSSPLVTLQQHLPTFASWCSRQHLGALGSVDVKRRTFYVLQRTRWMALNAFSSGNESMHGHKKKSRRTFFLLWHGLQNTTLIYFYKKIFIQKWYIYTSMKKNSKTILFIWFSHFQTQ